MGIHTNTPTDTYNIYRETILEHISVGVALYDAHTLQLLTANTLFLSFLDPQWRNGQAIGLPVTDWIPDAEATGVLNIYRTVAETGVAYRSGEYSFPSFERGVTYWNWTLDPIRDAQGEITQLALTASEITDQVVARKKTEEDQKSLSQTNRLVEAERRRLDVIETVARSVRESLDPIRISIAAIDAIRANFPAQYVYTHIVDPVASAFRLIHIAPTTSTSEGSKLVRYIPYTSTLPMTRSLTQRNPIIIEDLQDASHETYLGANHPLVRSNEYQARGYVCVPLWFGNTLEGALAATFSEPVMADSPAIQALIGSGTHLAAALAHARMHSEIEHERTRLHTILEQLPEGVLLVEALNSSITYANKAAADILDIPLPHLTGIPLNKQPHVYMKNRQNNRYLLPWNFAVTRALSGKTISGQETMITRPDGSKIVILSSIAPLQKQDGLITDAIIVFQDITAQKSIEQQKNEFLSIASHELRTPITAIQGFSEILQMQQTMGKSLDTSRTHYALDAIAEQSECLVRLIDEMLDISRLQHMRLDMNIAPHNLIATITQVVETQAATAKNHQLRLALTGFQTTDTLIVHYDENRVKQVLNNLIGNAIKYSPIQTEIEIGLHATHGEALIWVTDRGIGIPANQLPHVFKRFHRATNMDKSVSGLGIGLYLVKELVTRHGGRVWVDSIEQEGSTFYVALPLVSQ